MDEYQDEIDESEDMYEESQDAQEMQHEQLEANYPIAKEKSDIYNLFWKVLKLKDSTKVANLMKTEIGDLGVSVRDAQKLGMLGHIFHHDKFGNFWFALSEITNSTSMARQGWFAELFVSQKKFATRARKSQASSSEVPKWKMYRKKSSPAQ